MQLLNTDTWYNPDDQYDDRVIEEVIHNIEYLCERLYDMYKAKSYEELVDIEDEIVSSLRESQDDTDFQLEDLKEYAGYDEDNTPEFEED